MPPQPPAITPYEEPKFGERPVYGSSTRWTDEEEMARESESTRGKTKQEMARQQDEIMTDVYEHRDGMPTEEEEEEEEEEEQMEEGGDDEDGPPRRLIEED